MGTSLRRDGYPAAVNFKASGQVHFYGLGVSDMLLSQNFPNPFNPSTSIGYAVPSGSWVELAIFNVLGQRIATLLSQYQTKGTYAVTWNGDGAGGRAVNSGVYIAQLKVGEYVERIKMMLLK